MDVLVCNSPFEKGVPKTLQYTDCHLQLNTCLSAGSDKTVFPCDSLFQLGN